MLLKVSRQACDIVIVQHQGLRRDFRGNAGRTGVAESQRAGAGLHQQEIGVAVVTAFELDDLAAPGKAARQADGAHGGLGAGTHQTHLLHGRHQLAQQLGHFQFARGRRAEAQATRRGFLHRLDHFRVGMAEDCRPPGTDIIDVGFAVLVPQDGALAALEEHRRAADRAEGAHRGVHAAGNELLGLFE